MSGRGHGSPRPNAVSTQRSPDVIVVTWWNMCPRVGRSWDPPGARTAWQGAGRHVHGVPAVDQLRDPTGCGLFADWRTL